VPDDQFLANIDQQQTKIYDQRTPQCPSISPSAFQTGQQICIQSTGVVYVKLFYSRLAFLVPHPFRDDDCGFIRKEVAMAIFGAVEWK
jgi:hypothetical protein